VIQGYADSCRSERGPSKMDDRRALGLWEAVWGSCPTSATWGARWGGWGAGVPCPHLEMPFVGLVVVQLRPEPQLRIIRFRSNEVDRKFPGSPETRSVWYGIAHRRAIGKILRLLYGLNWMLSPGTCREPRHPSCRSRLP
jgi:hypothetical protein